MASDTGTTENAQSDATVTAPAEEPRLKRRRVRVRVRRKQEKFPRPLRIALLLGLPILLWTAIYFIGRALL